MHNCSDTSAFGSSSSALWERSELIRRREPGVPSLLTDLAVLFLLVGVEEGEGVGVV